MLPVRHDANVRIPAKTNDACERRPEFRFDGGVADQVGDGEELEVVEEHGGHDAEQEGG